MVMGAVLVSIPTSAVMGHIEYLSASAYMGILKIMSKYLTSSDMIVVF